MLHCLAGQYQPCRRDFPITEQLSRAYQSPHLLRSVRNIFFNIGTLILNARVRRGADSALCQFQTFLLQWYVCRYLCLGSGKLYVEIWNPDLIS